MSDSEFEEKLYETLSQTDCAGCGYDDCRAYAHALATGETKDISLCVPGDLETKQALKKLMEEKGLPYEGA